MATDTSTKVSSLVGDKADELYEIINSEVANILSDLGDFTIIVNVERKGDEKRFHFVGAQKMREYLEKLKDTPDINFPQMIYENSWEFLLSEPSFSENGHKPPHVK